MAPFRVLPMGNLDKGTKVIRRLSEVRIVVVTRNPKDLPHACQKGSLTRAVLADQQSQWRQPRALRVTKAAKGAQVELTQLRGLDPVFRCAHQRPTDRRVSFMKNRP